MHPGILQRRSLSINELTLNRSTGGIIALGFGVEGWTVESCIERFKQLCNKAFTPREMHGVPIFQQLAAFSHENSMYKTRPLLELLKDSFTEDALLFGGLQEKEHYVLKVAVTSTKDTGQQPVILANYNRPNKKNDSGMSMSTTTAILALTWISRVSRLQVRAG